jgi:uncharacterized protein (TIGR02996 family)
VTHTTDSLALLAAIRDNSDEDTPRLMWADAIEDTDPERAELARIQCEEASILTPVLRKVTGEDSSTIPDPLVQRHAELRTREEQLLAAHADRWRKGPVCGRPGCVDLRSRTASASCPDCHGTGDAGGLMCEVGTVGPNGERPWQNKVTYHRGMKRVECRAADCWHKPDVKCPDCDNLTEWSNMESPHPGCSTCGNHGVIDGPWRPTPWALAVCRHHPDCDSLWLVDSSLVHDGTSGWDTSLTPKDVIQIAMEMGLRWETPEPERRLILSRAVVRWVHTFL